MPGYETRVMVGRGPDGLPQVMEVDADGQLTGISEINTSVNEINTNMDTVLDGVADLVAGDHREKVYPWNTMGVMVVGGALSTWGACMLVIPIDGVREDYGHVVPAVGALSAYGLVGLSLISIANPQQALTWRIYRIAKTTGFMLNGNSGAAHAPATWVRIGDTSGFLVGDIVWLEDINTANGELGTVGAINYNDHLTLTAALTQNFTVAQSAYVYLARRVTATGHQCRTIWGKYRAAGVNNMRRTYFHAPRMFAAGDALVVEAYDLANVPAPGQIAVTAYYDDRH